RPERINIECLRVVRPVGVSLLPVVAEPGGALRLGLRLELLGDARPLAVDVGVAPRVEEDEGFLRAGEVRPLEGHVPELLAVGRGDRREPGRRRELAALRELRAEVGRVEGARALGERLREAGLLGLPLDVRRVRAAAELDRAAIAESGVEGGGIVLEDALGRRL